MSEEPMEWALAKALEPFILAAAIGHSIEEQVREANPNQHSQTQLIGFGGYVGQYAAQSRVSWADWKRLLDAAYDAGLLNIPESTDEPG